MKPATRYALVPGLSVLLLTVLLTWLAHAAVVEQLSSRAQFRVRRQAELLALQVDLALRDAAREVALLARSPQVRPERPAKAVRDELEFLQQRASGFLWLGLVAPDGTVLAGTRGWLEGRSIATRPVFTGGLKGSYVGDVHPSVALEPLLAQAGQAAPEVLDIGEPIRDERGRVVAVLAAHLGVGWVQRLRDQAMGGPDPGAPAEARTPRVQVFTGDGTRAVVPASEGDGAAPNAGPTGSPLQGGLRGFSARAPVTQPGETPLLPWQVVVWQPREEALAQADRILASMLLLGAVSAALAAAFGAWLAGRVLRPWGPMFDAVMARTGGQGDARAVAEAVAEVLNEREGGASGPEALLAQLASGTRELRRVVDHLPVAVAVMDSDLRMAYLNPKYSELLGWTTEEARGRPAGDFFFDAADNQDFTSLFSQVDLEPGEVAARYVASRPDGQRVTVEWHLVPMLDGGGRLAGALALVRDVGPERAARARADELAGRLRALADAAVDEALATLDEGGRVLEWSRGAERLSGLGDYQALGRPLASLLPTVAAPDMLARARRDGSCPLAGDVVSAGGRSRWLSGSLYPLKAVAGRRGFGLLLRDLTEQREAHRSLALSEERLRLALEGASLGTWEITFGDGPPRVRWSDGYARALGVPPELLPHDEQALFERIHPDDRDAVRAAVEAALTGSQPLDVEFRVPLEGQVRWHAVYGAIVRGAGDGVVRLAGVGRDVTERVGQQREIEAARADLVQLTRRLLEQEKETTRRLAQSLHDELGQTLTALRLHWDALEVSPERPAALRSRVATLLAAANEQIRGVLGELRPPMLDEFGLVAALDNEMQRQHPVTALPTLQFVALPRLRAVRWPGHVEYAAFMVAREALANALHHAEARSIVVTLQGDEGELRLAVQDDGIGIGAEQAAHAVEPGHLGLVGMRERALAIGAALRVERLAAGGTLVTMNWSASGEDLPGR